MTKILKRPLSILLVVMMVAGLFSAIPMTANAATVTDGAWSIDTNTGIASYDSFVEAAEIEVPESIAGYDVKGVSEYCFWEIYSLTRVVFKCHIDKLVGGTFQDCPALREVVFEKGVDELASGAICGTATNSFKLTINESANTVFNSSAIQTGAAAGNITIASLASNTGARTYQTSKGYNWEEVVAAHTHTWNIDSVNCAAEDKDTVTVNLVCADDSTHTQSVVIKKDDGDFTVVSTTDATCVATGTMVVNINFTVDGQEIAKDNQSVTIAAYEKHDYNVQKWTWWDDTPFLLETFCSHCQSSEYDDPDTAEIKQSFPKDYLRTVESEGLIFGRIKTNHQNFIDHINRIANYGYLITDNDYEYYTDIAPAWEWADDYSSATATFYNEDGTVAETMTDTEISSEQIIDTLDGDKEKTRYTATVERNGNVYNSERKVAAPVTHTITWLNDDGSLIDTTTVIDGVVPSHAEPVKAEDAVNTYTFSGWTPEVVAATEDAEYTAQFTAVPKHIHTYTASWTWIENEPSYTAVLKLTCADCDEKVTLKGDDITYDFNPYCTSYNGIETTYHVHAEYNGVIYEDTKTVPSIDTSNVMDGIALDNIMTTASEAKAQDNNQFGLSDGVYYRNLTVLGVQKKEAIATTDGLNQGRDIRFISVANSELLKNAKDYGFIVAVSGQDVWSTDKQINALTAENFENSMYSCKNTDNQICGDYGKRSTETDYKYVTLAVNGVEEDTTVAARFYVQDNNGVYHYAKYTNKYSKTYDGIAVKYSDLG